jgi:hypothetical protein
VARGWKSEADAAEYLGVSAALLTWRLNMTGAHRRVQRGRALAGGRRPRTASRGLTGTCGQKNVTPI